MLPRVAELRRDGRIRLPRGVGVLVKAPKPTQDRRFDLPTIGPSTIEGVAHAGLAGIAVVAGEAIVAEPATRRANSPMQANIFVVGVRSETMTMAAPPTTAERRRYQGVHGGLRGIRRSSRRGADARDGGAVGPVADIFRRRWSGHGARGRSLAVSDRRTCDRRYRRGDCQTTDDPAPHSPDRRRGHRGEPGSCWSSSTARISPIVSREKCAPPRRTFASSIMCRLRCGRGVRDARAPCALMSIMCWHCCRSSRRRTHGLAARRAPMSAIR